MPNRGKVWNGSEWVDLAPTATLQSATTSAPGITQLVDSVSSTSTASAAVPNSVKTTYDLASTKAKVSVGTATPSSPSTGDVWINTAGTATAINAVPLAALNATGAMIYASGAGTAATLGIGSTDQQLVVAGGVPAWAANPSITKATLTTTGDIIYASGSATPARLAIGTASQVLSVVGGLPSWTTLASSGADVQEFTSSGSWVKPSGKSAVYVLCVGGGGGGGSGNNSNGTGRGGFGGSGGAHSAQWLVASTLAGTVTVTIGSGGAGGTAAASSASNQVGVAGSFGGDTSFGTAVKAVGGVGGNITTGSTLTPIATGVAEWGWGDTIGTAARTSDSTTASTRTITKTDAASYGFALAPGRGGWSETADGNGTYAPLRAMTRTGGGGCGGNHDSVTAYNGTTGARGFGYDGTNTGSGGTASGGAGSSATEGLGSGGGGGGGHTNGTAGNGGNGYLGGGGGGGGGAYRSSGSAQGGNGGNGGGGYVLVISV